MSNTAKCDLDEYETLLKQFKEHMDSGREKKQWLINELHLVAKDGFMTDNDWEWKYEYEAALENKFQRLSGEYLWIEE